MKPLCVLLKGWIDHVSNLSALDSITLMCSKVFPLSCDDYGSWFKETQSSEDSNIMKENAILETCWAFKWLQSAFLLDFKVPESGGRVEEGPRSAMVQRNDVISWRFIRSKVSSVRRFKSTSRVLLLTSIVEMLLSFSSHRECLGYVKLQEVQCRSAEGYQPHLGSATGRWPPRHAASLR